ncbi:MULTISPECIES: formate dehydrogenase subunit gamma [Pseudomonas]|uniref:Formate dehydrogenase subunit gamma n=1 Tax=Pseudomonas helleri TaxID=1608996 RepID=A0A6L5HSU4_9PSED|nr:MULTISPECIES: formate dehydrogenase subunit gamma [Pseudomonas]MQT47897.1 formate dehydrogenase subunit gamma [Pseudomonas helleri]MQT60260.1 formate dehydrogenase subunit gamma [Pseudomonas sp. FSL R10-0399]MQT88734.1 formate dehydrogenase subunit gamma [Pseudomonas helleri]MQU06452.1 formate dehydrogenase subunit gamma [Pseudomonas helleri]
MNKRNSLLRTPYVVRISHWLMVICFFLVAMSGLSWFFPSLNWLNNLLGGPQLARILHPFLGVAIFVFLVYIFIRLVKYNLPEASDGKWFVNIGKVLKGEHVDGLDTGKYNAGQKVLFWGIMGLISLLLISGVVIWRPYFAPLFSIPLIRIGLMLHAIAGVLLMLLIIGHIYLAFWVKGSVGSMSTGYVSRKWARIHHPRWYRQITGDTTKKDHP